MWWSFFGPKGVSTFRTAISPRQHAGDPPLHPVLKKLQVDYIVAHLLAFDDLFALALRTSVAFYGFHLIDTG
jgi:hypothetical protein